MKSKLLATLLAAPLLLAACGGSSITRIDVDKGNNISIKKNNTEKVTITIYPAIKLNNPTEIVFHEEEIIKNLLTIQPSADQPTKEGDYTFVFQCGDASEEITGKVEIECRGFKRPDPLNITLHP